MSLHVVTAKQSQDVILTVNWNYHQQRSENHAKRTRSSERAMGRESQSGASKSGRVFKMGKSEEGSEISSRDDENLARSRDPLWKSQDVDLAGCGPDILTWASVLGPRQAY
jgi:hypothetical protein